MAPLVLQILAELLNGALLSVCCSLKIAFQHQDEGKKPDITDITWCLELFEPADQWTFESPVSSDHGLWGGFIMFADKVTMWNTNPFETSPCWQVHLPQFFVAVAAIPFVPAAGCFSKPSAVQTLKHQPGTTQETEREVNKNTIPSQDWQDWQATFCCFESNLWH